MAHERDAVLAVTLLCTVVVFGWLATAEPQVTWLTGGATATVIAEALSYRRATAVQSAFDRPWVIACSAAGGGVAIGAGAILAPNRALSFAGGALAAYLLLLGVATVAGWTADVA